jgi:hypothetical protein
MSINKNPIPDYRAGDSGYGLSPVGAGDDITNLALYARGVLVIGNGDFDVVTWDPVAGAEATVPFRSVSANTYHPIITRRVMATNLTATLYYIY